MDKLEKVAREAALRAGELQKSRLGKIKSLDYKSAFNIVTDVDKASEALIIETLTQEFPDACFLAEESGESGSKSGRRWIIDPLDGTTNFAHSYPFFCVSIACEEDGQVVRWSWAWFITLSPLRCSWPQRDRVPL